MKVQREACSADDWHRGDKCRYEDVRELVAGFVVVDERWRRIYVEVRHEVTTGDGPEGPEAYAVALFRLSGVRTRKPDFDASVNDNIDLLGPSVIVNE